MGLSQKFGIAALALGVAAGISGCSTYGEDKLPDVAKGTYHCESEALGAKISFDTAGIKIETGEGLLSEPAHIEVTQKETGLRVKLSESDEWVCETPNGGTTVLFSPL